MTNYVQLCLDFIISLIQTINFDAQYFKLKEITQ